MPVDTQVPRKGRCSTYVHGEKFFHTGANRHYEGTLRKRELAAVVDKVTRDVVLHRVIQRREVPFGLAAGAYALLDSMRQACATHTMARFKHLERHSGTGREDPSESLSAPSVACSR